MSSGEVLKRLLKEEITVLSRSSDLLRYSLDRSQKIELSTDMSHQEYEILDSFSSRFMRMYEVLTNQLLRTVLQVLAEHRDTWIDNMNQAEKMGFISSRKEMNEIRELRNMVAHEYLQEEWVHIYQRLLQKAPVLLEMAQMTLDEMKRRKVLKS